MGVCIHVYIYMYAGKYDYVKNISFFFFSLPLSPSLRRDIGKLKNVKTKISTFVKRQENLTVFLLMQNRVVQR